MLDDQSQNVLDEQQAIVSRYASQLRAAACGRGADAAAPRIRCYTLVNQCALELFELRRSRATDEAPEPSDAPRVAN